MGPEACGRGFGQAGRQRAESREGGKAEGTRGGLGLGSGGAAVAPKRKSGGKKGRGQQLLQDVVVSWGRRQERRRGWAPWPRVSAETQALGVNYVRVLTGRRRNCRHLWQSRRTSWRKRALSRALKNGCDLGKPRRGRFCKDRSGVHKAPEGARQAGATVQTSLGPGGADGAREVPRAGPGGSGPGG